MKEHFTHLTATLARAISLAVLIFAMSAGPVLRRIQPYRGVERSRPEALSRRGDGISTVAGQPGDRITR